MIQNRRHIQKPHLIQNLRLKTASTYLDKIPEIQCFKISILKIF